MLHHSDEPHALGCSETRSGYISQISFELKNPPVSMDLELQGFLNDFLDEKEMVCHLAAPGKVKTDSRKKHLVSSF